MAETGTLDADHRRLDDDLLSRRYVGLLGGIAERLPPVLAETVRDRLLTGIESEVIASYLGAIGRSVRALSMKYLFAGRIDGPLRQFLTIDIHESGFPVWSEIAQMAADAVQAAEELARTPDAAALKDDMVRQIVGELSIPTRLQYALSQRLYYEQLAAGGLFWPQMHPEGWWLSDAGARRRWLLHWAVYDSQLNLPVIYLMTCDDSGRRRLTEDGRRWPEVRAHLLAQSITGLHLGTIAEGFDRDFDSLHPLRLRRVRLGPVHSRQFTTQEGPIRAVLDSASAPPEDDWAMVLNLEDVQSEGAEIEPSGLFGVKERQLFRREAPPGSPADGVTRALVLPARPYQALAELDPPEFRAFRKYVPAADGRVVAYR